MTPPEISAWNFWRWDYPRKGDCDGFLFWQQTPIFLRIDLFIDVVAIQVIAENVQKITCLKKVLCKGTMFVFKCRWLCQCQYFKNGKLTQSCWDEKLWNYIAFIVSASIFFLNVARGGRKKLKCFFKKINGGVESLTTFKIVGRADG